LVDRYHLLSPRTAQRETERGKAIDWGERTGMAPGAVEVASFVVFDAKYLGLTRDEVIDEYRSLTSDFVEAASISDSRGTEVSRRYTEEALAWWSATVRSAFERTWALS
jgi:hypothetical protein